MPSDVQEVIHVFAVAARVVSEQPNLLDAVTSTLVDLTAQLVPPEAFAAQECGRLWARFDAAVRARRGAALDALGRALHSRLDALGQRLDLPPMDDWSELPRSLGGASQSDGAAGLGSQPALTVQSVRQQLPGVWPARGNTRSRAMAVAPLVQRVAVSERADLAASMVEQGVLGRGEAALLLRWLVKGAPVGGHDTVLLEVLEKIGRSLAAC